MSGILERLLKRDRLIVATALLSVQVLAWIYLLIGAGMDMTAIEMTQMTGPFGGAGQSSVSAPSMMMGDSQGVSWTFGYFVLMVAMWWIMMLAMMLPSASATILIFASISRRQQGGLEPLIPTGVFAAGYMVAWGIFSLFATSLQWGLEKVELLSNAMASESLVLGGILLIVAGLWQMTPLKYACLTHCRSPLDYLSRHWRDGRSGAVQMGMEHGAYCLGCCWAMMGLLFVGGVMNLYWIIGLALFVLIEKLMPLGPWFRWAAGAGLMVWGSTLILWRFLVL